MQRDTRIELCVAQADVWHRPSDDAIDMAIEALKLVTSYENTINKLTEAIANTQEPKTGHWIEEDMFDGDVAYRCSECDELFWLESGTPKDNEYNFCPKCGAKLESEEV